MLRVRHRLDDLEKMLLMVQAKGIVRHRLDDLETVKRCMLHLY